MLKIFILLITVKLMIFDQSMVSAHTKDKVQNDTIIYLNIPERTENAIKGSEFVHQVNGMNLTDREKAVVKEILSGNVPSFSRKLRPLKVNQIINGISYEVVFFTVCDYMAIGSEDDYLYIPMTPSTAQYVANNLNCSLPTKKTVDIIYNNSEIKLKPQPIPPSDKMTTIPVFKQHTDSIKQQIVQIRLDRSSNNIIAGHKKDIIISNKIYSSDRNYERVVIYGWHLSNNNPIQPVYNGHIAMYADYSHGVRLISKTAFINGDSFHVEDILNDQNLSKLFSNEGVIKKPFYPNSKIFTSIKGGLKKHQTNFNLKQNYPNPFNPSTTIIYSLPKSSFVNLKVFDMAGQEVINLVNEEQTMGNYSIKFNASALASGTYFYRLQSNSYSEIKKLVLLK